MFLRYDNNLYTILGHIDFLPNSALGQCTNKGDDMTIKIKFNGVDMSVEELRQSLSNTPPEKLYKDAINKLKRGRQYNGHSKRKTIN